MPLNVVRQLGLLVDQLLRNQSTCPISHDAVHAGSASAMPFQAPSSAYMPCHTVNSSTVPHLHVVFSEDTLTRIVRLLQ